MKRNPFKEKTTPSPTPKPQSTTLSTEDQKAFEAEVQERIRQAKMQLKASNPFTQEELSDTVIPESIDDTPAIIEKIVNKNNQTEHPNWENQKKELIDKLEEATKKIEKLDQALAQKNKENNQLERKPIYGMTAAQPSTDGITKDDLKLEFLNFTSAHIDQFNTRIRKTEEMVTNLANNQPRETAKSTSTPKWTQWLNTALLTLCSILLIALLLKKNEPQELQTAKTEMTATKQSSLPSNPAPNSTSNKTVIKEEAVATATKVQTAIATKPLVLDKNGSTTSTTLTSQTNNPTSIAAKSNTTIASKQSTDANTATASKKISLATIMRNQFAKAQITNKYIPAKQPITSKSNTDTKAISNTTTLQNKNQASTASEPTLSKPTATINKPAVKQATTIPSTRVNSPKLNVATSTKVIQARSNPLNTAQKQNIAEAIKPVEIPVTERSMASNRNVNNTITTRTTAKNKTQEEAKILNSKPKQKPNDVFFGDD